MKYTLHNVCMLNIYILEINRQSLIYNSKWHVHELPHYDNYITFYFIKMQETNRD